MPIFIFYRRSHGRKSWRRVNGTSARTRKTRRRKEYVAKSARFSTNGGTVLPNVALSLVNCNLFCIQLQNKFAARRKWATTTSGHRQAGFNSFHPFCEGDRECGSRQWPISTQLYIEETKRIERHCRLNTLYNKMSNILALRLIVLLQYNPAMQVCKIRAS